MDESRKVVETRIHKHLSELLTELALFLIPIERYEYLEHRRKTKKFPAVWMPRLSEIGHNGRNDLRQAIRAWFGVNDSGKDASNQICQSAGLVIYREWSYFEGLLDMLLELKRYLDRYHGGNYDKFPVVSHVKTREGFRLLHTLIQYYGGGTFVSSKLGMKYRKRRKRDSEFDVLSADLNWGPFDLDFGIELLTFVRDRQMEMHPPLLHPVIEMPTKEQLLAYDGEDRLGPRLHKQIEKFGGYENVARRLGLEYFDLR